MAKTAKSTSKKVTHALGDIVFVNDVRCQIKFIGSAGVGYCAPVFDDPEDKAIARHIVYGKINSKGEVTRL